MMIMIKNGPISITKNKKCLIYKVGGLLFQSGTHRTYVLRAHMYMCTCVCTVSDLFGVGVVGKVHNF